MSNISSAFSFSTLLFVQPLINCFLIFFIKSAFFLPIALRKLSASLRLNPANFTAISIACSWYTITPYVSVNRSSISGCRLGIVSLPCFLSTKCCVIDLPSTIAFRVPGLMMLINAASSVIFSGLSFLHHVFPRWLSIWKQPLTLPSPIISQTLSSFSGTFVISIILLSHKRIFKILFRRCSSQHTHSATE